MQKAFYKLSIYGLKQHILTYLSKLAIEGEFVILIKGTCKKSTANIILNSELLNAILLRMGKRAMMYTHIIPVQHHWRS